YCDHMAGEVKKREFDFKKSDQRLEHCRDKLVLAMQERTVLEKLKEKQYSQYKLVTSRLEQKELDDIAIGRYIRNQLQL
ncbi:MAG TPA: FliJ family protein, partial [Bacteroidales bacterium]|nr:FliJ family protein [Bacteroidales bacterium]